LRSVWIVESLAFPHEFEGATVKVDCLAFSRLDISEDVDEMVGKLKHPREFLLF
jgi:hypothetical protein